MNVLIIDNSEQIKPVLSDTAANISLYIDEVQALNAIEKEQPSVVFLNYAVRKEETLEYIKLILKASTDCKIIIIADELHQEKILHCLFAGAKGYQQIKQLGFYVNKLLKVVSAGELWVTRHMTTIALVNLRLRSTLKGVSLSDLQYMVNENIDSV